VCIEPWMTTLSELTGIEKVSSEVRILARSSFVRYATFWLSAVYNGYKISLLGAPDGLSERVMSRV
jgi:hypothetical protein